MTSLGPLSGDDVPDDGSGYNVWVPSRRRSSAAGSSQAGTFAAQPEYRLKRPLDLGLATIGLILSGPLWLALAAAIKLEDRGPVFYRQERWGRRGQKFHAYKFRSMSAAASAAPSVQARKGDTRITLVGRLMRKTALDELPQIINILKGDMSLVGPRALPVNEKLQNDPDAHLTDDQIPGFAARVSVRPGLTGIAQIYAPRDISRRKKFRYDALYARAQSLRVDGKLIVRSFWVSVTGRWEHYSERVATRRKHRRS